MKIGILTYHCVPNFGAQLQTLSMVGGLRRLGHTPLLLHWYPSDLRKMYENRVSAVQNQIQLKFAKENFPLSQLCETEEQLIRTIEKADLDLVITGSDALFKYVPFASRLKFDRMRFKFNLHYVSPLSVERLHGNPFFCGYYEKINKKIPIIAVAVSSQNCKYSKMTWFEKNLMSKYISNFDQITTRDSWTQEMVCSLINKRPRLTPDPVFSFNRNCYLEIPDKVKITQKFRLSDNYVLISFSSKFISYDYISELSAMLQKYGFEPVALTMPEGLSSFDIPKVVELPLSPVEWYSLIIHSNGFIGERMHPIVVCLHNAIPFFSFDEYGSYKRTLIPPKKIFINDSSKTFHIVEDFGYLDNYYSYHSNTILPNCENVVCKMLSFDKKKCLDKSRKKEAQFFKAISEMLSKYC